MGDETQKQRDDLTGCYLWESALPKIEEQMAKNPNGKFHVTMLHLWNTRQYKEEYGSSFALAIIGNLALVLQHFYENFGESVLISRIQKDTFFVFLREESVEDVERQAIYVYNELLLTYFGRDGEIRPKMTISTYHMPDGENDIREALKCAGSAVEYAKNTDTPVVVYWDFMKKAFPPKGYQESETKLQEECLENYDKQFLSFAMSLLASTADLDSSMNMVLLRIGWRFGFDEVSISEFLDDQKAILTNQWVRDVGVIDDLELEMKFEDWTGFFSSFNSLGVAMVSDILEENYPSDKREFFETKNIRSYINVFLYVNEQPIGYLSCSNREVREHWTEEMVNSLLQLSKLLAVFVSLRVQHKKNQAKIDALSRDDMTGLYRYPAFRRKVLKALGGFDEKKSYAFTYTDISNFSYLNEHFGYDEGNQVLQEFARRVKQNTKDNVIVCRLEGDRFLVFSIRNTKEEIENRVRLVNDEFEYYLSKKYPKSDLHVTSGIYFVENPEQKFFRMIDSANHARKTYKRQHHNSIGVFSHELDDQRRNVMDVVGNVHNAIRDGEIEAFLQPKFSMKSRKVQGAEALVRWRKKDGTFVFPNQFVPVLENAGYIVDVDMCVYEQVLKALVRWKEQGKRRIPISVNFSRVHFRDKKVYKKIIEMAERYGVEPCYIEIEITESTLASDRDNLYYQMSKLREYGFKIDIDDFGTGYSSLNMLLFAPVDIVKVDKSFIDNYTSQTEKDYINQIGNLILSAKKDIIFEGVETEEQSALLAGYGYDHAQGYLFSKPIPLKEFEEKYMGV